MVKGTRILREKNKRNVLALIRQLGQTSRQDLVKMMNVSKNTISLIVDELINENILEEVGFKEPGQKGRPKIIIKLKQDGFKSLGLSIRKTQLEYTIINYAGDLLEQKTYKMDGTDPQLVKKKILETIYTSREKYDNLIGIGIGIPAIIDSNKKFIHTSTHLGWKNVSMEELETLSEPVYVQNSVNMGAISALNVEGDNGEGSSFYIRVREGVGGAYLVNNMVIHGASWTAGEIGHIAIDPNAERCNCGQKGCLELLINLDTFIKSATRLGYSPQVKNGDIYFEDVLLHSKEIKELIFAYGNYLGKALVQVMHLMNPDKIVIDAPYNIYTEFQKACQHYLKQHALHIPYQQTEIIFGNKRYNMSRGAALSAIINYEKEIV